MTGFAAFMSFLMVLNAFDAINDWNRLHGSLRTLSSEQQKINQQLWIQLIFYVSLLLFFAYVTLEPVLEKPIQGFFEQEEKRQKEKDYLKLKKEQCLAYSRLREEDRTPQLKPCKTCDFLEQCLREVSEESNKPLCQR